ncbi:hypothetical protein C0Q70_07050 [Pomacea canaliculata]|uniref:VWFD domain-containing protein n=1 Tax=Pomacea canaliculata TaxID=400727 RepID=A0A2T7PDY4_POMCA|nr:hypothetical protein C0Q70_07050 [Pomacea canaliculata]
MGDSGGPVTILLGLLVYVTIYLPAVSSTTEQSRRCEYTRHDKIQKQDLCKNLIANIRNGSYLVSEISNEDISSDTKLCTYESPYTYTVKDCCQGWTGPSCNIPDCGGCGDGVCAVNKRAYFTAPPECVCPDDWAGQHCEENINSKSSSFHLKKEQWTKALFVVRAVQSEDPVGQSQQTTILMASAFASPTTDVLRASRAHPSFTPNVVSLAPKAGTAAVTMILTVILKCETSTTTYVLKNGNNTVTDSSGKTENITVTEEYQYYGTEAIYKRQDDSVYFYFPELSIRKDFSGYTAITVSKTSQLIGNTDGLCGNANGDPAGNSNAGREVGKKCGKGFHACSSEQQDEAAIACDFLRSDKYAECIKGGVDVKGAIQRCMRAYCSSDDKEKAICNQAEDFASWCYGLTGKIPQFREADFCPKTCDNGKVYTPVKMTNCDLRCGMPQLSYLSPSCRPEGQGGCVCPVGMALQNSTCVQPENCQCRGTDNVYYNPGDLVASSDKCLVCTCGDLGLWNCEPNEEGCMTTCTIIGNKVRTFDSLIYGISSSSPYTVVLLQSKEGNIKLEASYQPCASGTCISGLRAKVGNFTSSLTVSPDSAPVLDKPVSSAIYSRKISKNHYATDFLTSGIRIIFSVAGTIQIRANTLINKNKLYGMCGTPNGDIKDEMRSPSGSDMDNSAFIGAYCSQCPGTVVVQGKLSGDQSPICDQVMAANLDAAVHSDISSFKTICESMTTDQNRCQVLQTMAQHYQKSFESMFGNSVDCAMTEQTVRDVCKSNCIDFTLTNCEKQSFFDGGCGSNQYYRDQQCVEQDQCGCFNMNTTSFVEPGNTTTVGCHECTCNGTKMQCNTKCEEVICAEDQISYVQFQKDPVQNHQMCPDKYQITRKYVADVRPNQQCYCKEGLLQTYSTDQCVTKCPCFESDTWFKDGYTITKGCKNKTCIDGIWNVTDDDNCMGSCIVSGSTFKIKQFDADGLTKQRLNNKCEYTFLTTNDVTIKIGLLSQREHFVKFEVTALSQGYLQLVPNGDGAFIYNGKTYDRPVIPGMHVAYTGSSIDVSFNNSNVVVRQRGRKTTIFVKKSVPILGGLCGNFDGLSNNDLVGKDKQPKPTFLAAADSWAEGVCVQDSTPPSIPENPLKKQWAEENCRIIKEGEPFKPCRGRTTENSQNTFLDECVLASMDCNSGGDCDCQCDAIDAYADYCAWQGSPAAFRSPKICPVMCEGGSVYQACGDPCPPVCGHKTDCSDRPCVGGCFCPEGYIRENLHDMTCIPESQCSCFLNGRTVAVNHTVTINCQTCTCWHGQFKCTGERCKEECDEHEFRCDSGECIDSRYTCDGASNCADSSDERGCTVTNCTEFKCSMFGQCFDLKNVCDGIMDCSDGSDEADCGYTCGPDEFQCKKGCIPKRYVCDNYFDCSDGFDEQNCIPSTTPKGCTREEVPISSLSPDVTVTADRGDASSIFGYNGWTPDGRSGTVYFSLTSRDNNSPQLMSLTVDVDNSGSLELAVYDKDNNLVFTGSVQKGSRGQTFTFPFTEFHTIGLTTSERLSNLIVYACYEPSEGTTAVPGQSTAPACNEPLSLVIRDSSAPVDTSGVVKDVTSPLTFTIDVTEPLRDSLEGMLMLLKLRLVNCDTYTIKDPTTDAILLQGQTTVSTGVLTLSAQTAIPLPLKFEMHQKDGNSPISAQIQEVKGCTQPRTTETPLISTVSATTAPTEETISTPCPDILCDGRCISSLTELCNSSCAPAECATSTLPPTGSTISQCFDILNVDVISSEIITQDQDGESFKEFVMTIRPSDDQVNPVTLNLITLLLTNCDTMEIREGDTANIMLQTQVPYPNGPVTVNLDSVNLPVTFQFSPKDRSKSVSASIKEVRGCSGKPPPPPPATTTPTITSVTTPPEEITSTHCPFIQCNGRCISSLEELCESSCAPPECATRPTEPPTITTIPQCFEKMDFNVVSTDVAVREQTSGGLPMTALVLSVRPQRESPNKTWILKDLSLFGSNLGELEVKDANGNTVYQEHAHHSEGIVNINDSLSDEPITLPIQIEIHPKDRGNAVTAKIIYLAGCEVTVPSTPGTTTTPSITSPGTTRSSTSVPSTTGPSETVCSDDMKYEEAKVTDTARSSNGNFLELIEIPAGVYVKEIYERTKQVFIPVDQTPGDYSTVTLRAGETLIVIKRNGTTENPIGPTSLLNPDSVSFGAINIQKERGNAVITTPKTNATVVVSLNKEEIFQTVLHNEGGIVIVDRQGPFSIILISQNIEDDSVPAPSFIKLCGPPVTGTLQYSTSTATPHALTTYHPSTATSQNTWETTKQEGTTPSPAVTTPSGPQTTERTPSPAVTTPSGPQTTGPTEQPGTTPSSAVTTPRGGEGTTGPTERPGTTPSPAVTTPSGPQTTERTPSPAVTTPSGPQTTGPTEQPGTTPSSAVTTPRGGEGTTGPTERPGTTPSPAVTTPSGPQTTGPTEQPGTTPSPSSTPTKGCPYQMSAQEPPAGSVQRILDSTTLKVEKVTFDDKTYVQSAEEIPKPEDTPRTVLYIKDTDESVKVPKGTKVLIEVAAGAPLPSAPPSSPEEPTQPQLLSECTHGAKSAAAAAMTGVSISDECPGPHAGSVRVSYDSPYDAKVEKVQFDRAKNLDVAKWRGIAGVREEKEYLP